MIKTADIPRHVTATGQISFAGADAMELLLRGFAVTELCFAPSVEIIQHNAICVRQDKTPLSTELTPDRAGSARRETWWLPGYADLALRPFLLARCERPDERVRVDQELRVYEAHGLLPVLRLMVMLVDHWRARGVVWGVGRGSSVASYVLFLIGVHRIDSLAHDLAFEEFLKL